MKIRFSFNLQSSSGNIQFSVQYARNQVFTGAHNKNNDILEVSLTRSIKYSSKYVSRKHLKLFNVNIIMGEHSSQR